MPDVLRTMAHAGALAGFVALAGRGNAARRRRAPCRLFVAERVRRRVSPGGRQHSRRVLQALGERRPSSMMRSAGCCRRCGRSAARWGCRAHLRGDTVLGPDAVTITVAGVPGRNRGKPGRPDVRDLGAAVGWARAESGSDGDWLVRSVPGAQATKYYR